MKIRCIIIDDESHAIDVLKDYIAMIPDFKLIGTYEDPLSGLNQVNVLQPDIVFLDIEMPGMSGLELSQLITGDTRVIFTTASPDFAIEAFNLNVFHYLLKPISQARFQKCVNKVLDHMSHLKPDHRPVRDHIYLSENKGKLVKINFQDIYYIESNNNYITVNLENAKHNCYISLKEFASQLPDELLYRINKSFIVNLNKVHHLDGNLVILTDKTVLQIGNTYKEDFLKFISKNVVKIK